VIDPDGVCVGESPLLRVVVGVPVLEGVMLDVGDAVTLDVCVRVAEKDPVRLGVPERLRV
jgi:hypothetical protein